MILYVNDLFTYVASSHKRTFIVKLHMLQENQIID